MSPGCRRERRPTGGRRAGAAEAEHDGPEERAEERARGSHDAQETRERRDGRVDREGDREAAEARGLERVRDTRAAREEEREGGRPDERRKDVVVQLGRQALDGSADERAAEEADELP